ncbi:hypothetical protein TIFTF001_055538 [Ficus carica]|uniref:Uncharacterized protein n=1 Tax=Ficus carica TaxID=3494 RepID=A0AA88EB61_FICCA|nr:hypothetical protein TIFTF001_055538 [Ficus carica]
MSSDAEVAGCSMIRWELGSRGPGYPGCFARPWLEWSVARGASVSFGCWKGGCPPSRAKMTFRGLGCSGRSGLVGYGITQAGDVALNLHTCRPTMTPRIRPKGRYGDSCRRQQGQPLPGMVAAGGDVTRCRSGQAEPAVDGTCVRKGVTGGARAPRALSLWNALVRGGSSRILVG